MQLQNLHRLFDITSAGRCLVGLGCSLRFCEFCSLQLFDRNRLASNRFLHPLGGLADGMLGLLLLLVQLLLLALSLLHCRLACRQLLLDLGQHLIDAPSLQQLGHLRLQTQWLSFRLWLQLRLVSRLVLFFSRLLGFALRLRFCLSLRLCFSFGLALGLCLRLGLCFRFALGFSFGLGFGLRFGLRDGRLVAFRLLFFLDRCFHLFSLRHAPKTKGNAHEAQKGRCQER
mmetsp:Transcript_64296/g.153503  ORF Transcript_64296/g.153503 Transcript_64296/m.153503 type:complete len:229 (-) Transcript_64296:30-716(-)